MGEPDRFSNNSMASTGNNFARYRVPQQVASTSGVAIIKNDRGEATFEIDGGTQATDDIIRVRDLTGTGVCLIRGNALRAGEKFDIVDPDEMTMATIERVELSPVRDQFLVRIGPQSLCTVEGLVADYEYWIRNGDGEIAHISRRWFRARDSFGIQIAAGNNDLVLLTIAVGLDHLVHGSV